LGLGWANVAGADLAFQVNALADDAYTVGIETAVIASMICGSIACVLSVLLSALLHGDLSAWVLSTFAGIPRAICNDSMPNLVVTVKIKASYIEHSSNVVRILILIPGCTVAAD
jgi:hypothetical protein